MVEDEDLEGEEVTLVILDTNDALIAQMPTRIGGER